LKASKASQEGRGKAAPSAGFVGVASAPPAGLARVRTEGKIRKRKFCLRCWPRCGCVAILTPLQPFPNPVFSVSDGASRVVRNNRGNTMQNGIFTRSRMAAIAAALLAGAASPALAVDVTFTFSSTFSDGNTPNAVPGSVSGRIIGLTDNATSAATSVFIDSFAAAGFSGVPVDAVSWNIQDVNSFTLVGGVITAASFHADNSAGLDRLYLNINVGWPHGFTNYASVGVANDISIWNNDGFRGVTYGGTVPEPASWAMMITGFGLAGTALRRRRSLATA
jgi:hypothetical protein